jgi:hypothetical protein
MVFFFPWALSWMVMWVKVLEILQAIMACLPLDTKIVPSVQVGLSQSVEGTVTHVDRAGQGLGT